MSAIEKIFVDRLGVLGPALLGAIAGIEMARRQLHPPRLPELRAALAPARTALGEALAAFEAETAPDGLTELAAQLARASHAALRSLELLVEAAPSAEGVARILAGMHHHCRAQEELFPLRKALPPVSRFFLEPGLRDRLSELDPEQLPAGVSVGLHRGAGDGAGRGGFSLYVPESYDGTSDWPLVVALHGGSGNGDDFLWSWLIEARGRRFLLLAPTARGPTWSLMGSDIDAPALRKMIALVCERWRVSNARILLTGLSDGATYALRCALQPEMPFTALAPVSGVLHPELLEPENLERVRGRRIYLVHGALDWMFPIETARVAHEVLERAGAEIVFREIADLSHTYPREENDRILTWFDPSLALPGAAA
jgi:phospholipase/carboxylesterase